MARERPADAPSRDDVAELLAAMRGIKGRGGGGKTNEIFNLEFRGVRFGDMLDDLRKLDVIKWIQAKPHEEPQHQGHLTEFLDSPAAAEAVAAAAAAPKNDFDRLMESMHIIKTLPGTDKAKRILNLEFRGRKLGDILGGQFDVVGWLQSPFFPAVQERLEGELRELLDRRAGMAWRLAGDVAPPGAPSPAAAPARDDVAELLAAMRGIKGRGGGGKTNEIFNLEFRGVRFGDMLDDRRQLDVINWIQAKPYEEPEHQGHLTEFLDSPAAAEAVAAAAAAPKNDFRRLAESMHIIKTLPGTDKAKRILNLEFRGRKLGDILGGQFDVVGWLQSPFFPAVQERLEGELRELLDRRAGMAWHLAGDVAPPGAPSPAAAPARGDARVDGGRFAPAPTPPAVRGGGGGGGVGPRI